MQKNATSLMQLQVPLVGKSRPLAASLPFTATTTAKADYTAPTRRAEKYHKAKAEQVPSAPLTNATVYRFTAPKHQLLHELTLLALISAAL